MLCYPSLKKSSLIQIIIFFNLKDSKLFMQICIIVLKCVNLLVFHKITFFIPLYSLRKRVFFKTVKDVITYLLVLICIEHLFAQQSHEICCSMVLAHLYYNNAYNSLSLLLLMCQYLLSPSALAYHHILLVGSKILAYWASVSVPSVYLSFPWRAYICMNILIDCIFHLEEKGEFMELTKNNRSKLFH